MKKYVDGVLTNMTAEEIADFNAREIAFNNGALDRALDSLRQKRNSLLIETDYLALSDVTMSSAMTTYRQALRDITNGLDTVAKVETKMELNVNEDNEPIFYSYKNFPIKPA